MQAIHAARAEHERLKQIRMLQKLRSRAKTQEKQKDFDQQILKLEEKKPTERKKSKKTGIDDGLDVIFFKNKKAAD